MANESNLPLGAQYDRSAPFNAPWIEDEECEICAYPLTDEEVANHQEICNGCWLKEQDAEASQRIAEAEEREAA